MKTISFVKEFNGCYNAPTIQKSTLKTAIKQKEIVLNYIKSFEPVCVSGMFLVDEITNKPVYSQTQESILVEGYTDGEFAWDTREIYHFEKYNLMLDAEFVEHILNNN